MAAAVQAVGAVRVSLCRQQVRNDFVNDRSARTASLSVQVASGRTGHVVTSTDLGSYHASSVFGTPGFYLSAKGHRSSKSVKRLVVPRADVQSPPSPPAEAEAEPKRKSRPGEHKGFVEEMRIRAMKLHTKDQSKEGEKAAQAKPLAKWEPTKKGYLQFLVDSKAVYDTMEAIVERAAHPMYSEFRNTGLERSAGLAKDLTWFEAQGLEIPQPDKFGSEYSQYLRELSETDPPAFICHFYNVYFAHSAGGRMIGRKVAEMILDGQELNFYKWEGDLPDLLAAVKEKLNLVSADWTREEKDHCLEETEKSFKYSGSILRLLVS